MTYRAAILLGERALGDTVYHFERQKHAHWAAEAARRVVGAAVTALPRPAIQRASALHLREVDSWLVREFRAPRGQFEAHFIRLCLSSPDREQPYSLHAPERSPVVAFPPAPPIVEFYWSDLELDRDDWETYVRDREMPPEPAAIVNHFWAQDGLDRQDWEHFVEIEARKEELRAEGISEEEIEEAFDPSAVAAWQDMVREEADSALWDDTFAANGGDSDDAAVEPWPRHEPQEREHTLLGEFSRAHDFDEWEPRGSD